MNYIIVNPSLKHRCLATKAIELLSDDVIALLPKTSYLRLHEFTHNLKVLKKMREKVKNLPLPKSLEMELLGFIKPIGFQIYQWSRYLRHFYTMETKSAKDIRWTPEGTIDKVKTVKCLLMDRSLGLRQRYRLACTFCLVGELEDLLKNEIPEDEKLPELAYSNLVQANEQELVLYFTQNLKYCLEDFGRDPVAYSSPYHEACHVAILSCNPIATQYFFQKLSLEEKNLIFSLLQVEFSSNYYIFYKVLIPDEFLTQLMCFLLSQMSNNQQVEVLKRCSKCVFQSLLIWPCNRDFVLETANRMWNFVLESDFNFLLSVILSQLPIENREENANYREIFFELWQQSPVLYRKYIVNNFRHHTHNFFTEGELKICKLILNNNNDRSFKKENLLILEDGAPYLIREKKWNFFKFLIEEYLSSREKIDKLKKYFMSHYVVANCDDEIRQIVQLLDNCNHSLS